MWMTQQVAMTQHVVMTTMWMTLRDDRSADGMRKMRKVWRDTFY
jgi:hypothetical protein